MSVLKVVVRKFGFVSVDKKTQKHILRCDELGLCYACGEPIQQGETVVRHTHERCYRALHRAVQRGDYTDEELVEAGKWAAPESGGRPRNHIALRGLPETA